MNQGIAVAGLVLALAMTGCGPAKGPATGVARELATEFGTGTDDVARWISRSADAAGASSDDTASAWKARIAAASRLSDIPKTPATEAACSALSSIVFTDLGDDPFTTQHVLETLVGAVGAASGTPWATYNSLESEVNDALHRMNKGEPIYLDLVLLRQTYCSVVLGL